MVGLLLLKQLENFSDERVVLQFKRNPYYQYFCGYSNYMPGMPCNATELVLRFNVMTLCQLVKAIDDFNRKFSIGGVGDVFF
jgi:hypothetical protein